MALELARRNGDWEEILGVGFAGLAEMRPKNTAVHLDA